MDKFGQKQLENTQPELCPAYFGAKVKIKSEITPDNAGMSGALAGSCFHSFAKRLPLVFTHFHSFNHSFACIYNVFALVYLLSTFNFFK